MKNNELSAITIEGGKDTYIAEKYRDKDYQGVNTLIETNQEKLDIQDQITGYIQGIIYLILIVTLIISFFILTYRIIKKLIKKNNYNLRWIKLLMIIIISFLLIPVTFIIGQIINFFSI